MYQRRLARTTLHSPGTFIAFVLLTAILFFVVQHSLVSDSTSSQHLKHSRSFGKNKSTPRDSRKQRQRLRQDAHTQQENPKIPKLVVPAAQVLQQQQQAEQLQEHLISPGASHFYRPDGLLEVNSNASHPILELISRAQDEWNDKLRRASKTLDEAVDEYTRRYNRLPPANFNKWWDYVVANDVQLPDEYDTIYESIEPFWGVNPADLQSAERSWESTERADTIVVGKSSPDEPIRILQNLMKPIEFREIFAMGIEDRIDMLREVEDWIPPFRTTMTPHDNPSNFVDWELREEMLQAARTGMYIDTNRRYPRKQGWRAACAPSSPANSFPYALNTPYEGPIGFTSSPSQKAFIYDHKLSMNACLHPYHLVSHSQFLSNMDGGPVPSTPQNGRLVLAWSNCATMNMHWDLRAIPIQAFEEDEEDLSWEEKEDERLLWRGSSTGMWHRDNELAHALSRQTQRERLVKLANSVEGTVEILPPRGGSEDKGTKSMGMGEPEIWKRARINPAMLDIAFAGEPIQCDGSSCDSLFEEYEWRQKMSYETARKYKYIMDVDGNGWSARFRRLMTSNSLIFKSTLYPEWFTDRIQPWVHYVPILSDYSDLLDSLVFFRGDLKGEGGHEEMAKRIGEGGAQWTKQFARREDMVAYMFRFMLEYARVMSLDRDSLTYRPSSEFSDMSDAL